MASTSNQASVRVDSYLALIPRGFQHTARESITKQLSEYNTQIEFVGEAIADESSYANHITTLLKAQQEKGRKKNSDIEPCCSLPAGSSVYVEDKKNVSIGYIEKTKPILACPGVLPGVVWVKIITSAPVDFIARQLRVVGPLISLVSNWENLEIGASQSLEEAIDYVRTSVKSTEDYSFSKALNLWHSHVRSAWNLSEETLETIGDKIKRMKSMNYRLSMIRSDSEKYKYTRQEFLAQMADIVVPRQLHEGGNAWKVDLTNYDIEVVLLMHTKALAVGLALRPYQHLNVKSFASGNIPPDVSPPVLPGEVLAKVIRLRPTTAELLLHLAQIEPGDVVLDPCAGVGTIPVEAMFQKTGVVGLGGDLVLTPQTLGPIAFKYSRDAHNLKKTLQASSSSCSDLMAWDATCLPVRTASVDVVVSDLPFGQQCLSKAKLDVMLPLMFAEMARVLRPKTGRIVLLCGNYVPIVRALHQLNPGKQTAGNEEVAIETPFNSIFPANIGGLMAWIVVVKRGEGQPRALPNYRERVRKVAGKREKIEKCREHDRKSKKRSDFQS